MCKAQRLVDRNSRINEISIIREFLCISLCALCSCKNVVNKHEVCCVDCICDCFIKENTAGCLP
jgi:hypothetical protein